VRLAVASEVAQFALPGIKSGIFCTTPGVGVARNLAPQTRLEMLFHRDLIDAKNRAFPGLVNRVAPLRGSMPRWTNSRAKIVAHSSAVVSLGKRFFYDQWRKDWRTLIPLRPRHGLQHDAGRRRRRDRRFIQSAPDWRGR